MRQARQLGQELYVGVHSDEDIAENKGPVVMHLDERVLAVSACKWCTTCVPNAPYVTDPLVMDQYQCKYVVHGDDITTDAGGEDCYRIVKEQGRFIVVKRTPNISTTDLVGRMLLFTTTHHIKDITEEDFEHYKGGDIKLNDHPLLQPEEVTRYTEYATSSDGKSAGSGVYIYTSESSKINTFIEPSLTISNKLKKKIIYVDGGFDLFNPGHIEFLRVIHETQANKLDAAVVIGIHNDKSVHKNKGLNYPIMNLFERSLCVLQCRYVDAIILGAPYIPDTNFIKTLQDPQGVNWHIDGIYHGPTPEVAISENGENSSTDAYINPYAEAIRLGLFKQIGPHKYDNISTKEIVDRVLENRAIYEERQRKKGWKSQRERNMEAEEKGKISANIN